MTLKSNLAILAGKSSQFILQTFFKRGSTFPGKLALKIDPNILDTIARDYEIVVITGTNGKTLTTALTVGILENTFGHIVTNTTGANMITGIVSTFLSTKRQKSGRQVAVLEIDEASGRGERRPAVHLRLRRHGAGAPGRGGEARRGARHARLPQRQHRDPGRGGAGARHRGPPEGARRRGGPHPAAAQGPARVGERGGAEAGAQRRGGGQPRRRAGQPGQELAVRERLRAALAIRR